MSSGVVDRIARILEDAPPVLVAIVGSNGAGKTTFFDVFLRHTGLPFVNADAIARSLGPQEDPYGAAKIAAAVRADLVERRDGFCMESVFSDPAGDKVQWLRDAQRAGYRVLLVYIRIENAEVSMGRVQQRVDAGGHDVPDDKLVARFPRTLANVREALGFVDYAVVLDNSEIDRPFRHVETWQNGVRVDE